MNKFYLFYIHIDLRKNIYCPDIFLDKYINDIVLKIIFLQVINRQFYKDKPIVFVIRKIITLFNILYLSVSL